MDRPEWSVSVYGSDVYAASDDFTHDVMLRIGGDFWDMVQKEEYAQKICDILNAHGPIVLDSDVKDQEYLHKMFNRT